MRIVLTLGLAIAGLLIGAGTIQSAAPASARAKAVAAIEKLGGTITFDESKPDKPATKVNFQGKPITDGALAQLKSLSTLEEVDLEDTPVTDAALGHLRTMKELTKVILTGTRVTQAGVDGLHRQIPALRVVWATGGPPLRTPQEYAARAAESAKAGEFQKAIADFTAAIRLAPNVKQLYSGRGDAWTNEDRFEKALADYNTAIRIDPSDLDGYRNRVWVLHDLERYDEMLADCNLVLEQDPKDSYALNLRGMAWDGKKEHDKAIADYTESVRLDPNERMGWYNRGLTYWTKNNLDAAIADFKEAIRCDSEFIDAYSLLAFAYAENGDFKTGIEWETKAISIAPPDQKSTLEAELKALQEGKTEIPERRWQKQVKN